MNIVEMKEALMELNRLLADAVAKESFDVSGSITRPGKGASVEQLASQLQHFR